VRDRCGKRRAEKERIALNAENDFILLGVDETE
jgi:hypothetical protein